MHTAIAFALMAGALGAMPLDKKPVVITTDIGAEVDDQWTISHMALSPEIDLKGIVTTHAPNLAAPSAETSANYARELVGKLAAKSRPPVLVGSSKALSSPGKPIPNSAVDFLVEQARGKTAENRLTVVVLGAATDVASALLTDPTWADRVSIVAMGFNGYPQGGDPWNVKNDPIAWRTLLESRVPIVVGDVEVTKKLLRMTPDRAHTILLGMATAESRPRPKLRDDLSFDLENPQGTIQWITSIDEGKLWPDLAAKIKAAAP
jgi:purine nucleosidase